MRPPCRILAESPLNNAAHKVKLRRYCTVLSIVFRENGLVPETRGRRGGKGLLPSFASAGVRKSPLVDAQPNRVPNFFEA